MSALVTIGVVLGSIVSLAYLVRNRRTLSRINLFDPIYRSFMYTAGVVLGSCTVYYAITGNYPLDLTHEDLRPVISIGGFLLLFECLRAIGRLLSQEPPR